MSSVNIKICNGHVCRKKLSQYLFDRAAAELGIEDLEKGTSADGKISLERCGCMDRCSKGPIVVVHQAENVKHHERVSPVEMGNIIKSLK